MIDFLFGLCSSNKGLIVLQLEEEKKRFYVLNFIIVLNQVYQPMGIFWMQQQNLGRKNKEVVYIFKNVILNNLFHNNKET